MQWPDGRRAFATNSLTVSAISLPELSDVQMGADGRFSFQLTGTPLKTFVIQASTDLAAWTPISTNSLPSGGAATITDSQAASSLRRYYRALQLP